MECFGCDKEENSGEGRVRRRCLKSFEFLKGKRGILSFNFLLSFFFLEFFREFFVFVVMVGVMYC